MQVKLIGEGADDAGGVFDDTITEMCRELAGEDGGDGHGDGDGDGEGGGGRRPLDALVRTPNGRAETGLNRDRFVLNPDARTAEDLRRFWFLGESAICFDLTSTW